MKIAVVSKLWEPTTPESTGGTGASVGYLCHELKKMGHEVTLFASSDSTQEVKLVSVKDSGSFRSQYSEVAEFLNISQAFDKRRDFDVIHCNNEHKSLFFGAVSSTPSLHAVRYGEFFSDELNVFERYRHLNFVGISEAVKKMLPELNWRGIVHNGLDIDKFPYNGNKEDYLLFLARLSSQKGPDVAIRVAKKLGKKLIIAGKRADSDAAYLAEKVDPYIDGEQIRYVGEVDFPTKINLYSKAACLLHPINYIEAFGMTLIESLACGTPVIAFDKGAISEVIETGKTGFVISSEDEMLESIKNLAKIDPLLCRQTVEERFTVAKMAQGYEKLYKEIK